ncbi:MAG: hypothetical protein RIE32_01600 [Phycisphaerales bacterium]
MREVVTSLDGALPAQVGPVDGELIQTLRSHGFDGAPVLDAEEKLIGFVPTPLLAELAANGQHLAASTPGLWTKVLGAEPTVDELLRFTLDQPAGIVRDENGRALGFFTLSDLNRHPVRAALYPLFAELEAELAILVGSSFKDPWEWLELVPKDRRAALVGYWKISERDDVDIGPIAGAMLSELGGVVAKHEPLRSKLSFESRRQWEETFNGLNEQRHSIMHPVRPLVSNLDDLAKLVERLDKLLDLIGRVTSATRQPEAAS